MKRIMLVLTVVMVTMFGVESCGPRSEEQLYEDCVQLYVGVRDLFDKEYDAALIEANDSGENVSRDEAMVYKVMLFVHLQDLLEDAATACVLDGKVTKDGILKGVKMADSETVNLLTDLFEVEGTEGLAKVLYKSYKSAPRVELTMEKLGHAESEEYFTQEHDARILVSKNQVRFGAYDENLLDQEDDGDWDY